MNPIGKRLQENRKRSKLTQPQVAAYLSKHGKTVSFKAVSRWESEAVEPSVQQFLLMCELYGIDDVLGEFLGKEKAHRLNAEGRVLLDTIENALEKSGLYSPATAQHASRVLRLYDIPVSAGTGQFLDDGQYTEVEVDETVPASAAFGVRVAGDSMIPRFAPGQIVWVQAKSTLENGEFGVFSLNGDAYIKKLDRENGRPQLVSINPAYSPIDIAETDDLVVFGKVVGHQTCII